VLREQNAETGQAVRVFIAVHKTPSSGDEFNRRLLFNSRIEIRLSSKNLL
jgi:hypothetical protein